jgi:hypothetical protein
MSHTLIGSNITESLYQPNVEKTKQPVTTSVNQESFQINSNDDAADMTQKIKKVRRTIPFWGENPNVIFHNPHMFEFFPVEGMTYSQKLNAITRTILIITIISFIISKSIRSILFSLVTLGAIYMLNHFHNKDIIKNQNKKKQEGFEGAPVATELFQQYDLPTPDAIFSKPDSSNPFGNVLITDYDYNPDKKPAPPSFNKNIEKDVLAQAKQFVADANPDHPDIAEKLFKDAGSELMFEQSLRPFNSNPSTTIPNDQAGFAEFCYGSMISCKEGNEFACARNLVRHTN